VAKLPVYKTADIPREKDLHEGRMTRWSIRTKDAQIIFGDVWKKLEREYGRESLRFPKELILLGGAPGAALHHHRRAVPVRP